MTNITTMTKPTTSSFKPKTRRSKYLTLELWELYESLRTSDRESELKQQIVTRIYALLSQHWPSVQVCPFGSSINGFGFENSDLDIGLFFSALDEQTLEKLNKASILQEAAKCLMSDFQLAQFIPARIPVLKFKENQTQIPCDISFGNHHAIQNTALLQLYGELDPRVKPLVFAVKYWAQQRELNHPVQGTLSSYAYVLMVIHFLQQTAILPVLAPETYLQYLVDPRKTVQNESLAEANFGFNTAMNLGILLRKFFHYYVHEFQLQTCVISIRMLAVKTKSQNDNLVGPDWRLSIEDPFEHRHDLGKVLFHRESQILLETEFHRAWRTLEDEGFHSFDEQLCARRDTSVCYICKSTAGHSPRECLALPDYSITLKSPLLEPRKATTRANRFSKTKKGPKTTTPKKKKSNHHPRPLSRNNNCIHNTPPSPPVLILSS